MKAEKYDKKLDELIGRAISRQRPTFDFDKWQKNHEKEIQDFKSPAAQLPQAGRPLEIWRITMKRPVAKLVAAAAVIFIAVLGISLLRNSATTAYAIQQTIEVGRDVRYLHFYYVSFHSRVPDKEAWLEYDDSGQLKNSRVNWYKSGGGDMVVVWKEGRTQFWRKEKNRLMFWEDAIYTKKVVGFAKRYDPTSTVENLYDLERKGDVEIEIDEPANKTDPIILTCTWLPNTFMPGGTSPQMREIVFVDPVTKLVTSIELYVLEEDGEYEACGVWEYPDYDTLFEPGIFDLEGQVPADVKRLDLMTLDIGLEQTDLTNKEIALKVVRSFLQALIAKDYDRAIKIYGYEDPDEKEELLGRFEKLNIVGIISIDEPISPRQDPWGRLEVPCKVELAEDGRIIEWQIEDVSAQRVIGHPNRWRVKGEFER
ncbi:MAG: hypothetical protein ACYTEL_08295 [Planctomycetota bacterium]|jgi:hypothetical protein